MLIRLKKYRVSRKQFLNSGNIKFKKNFKNFGYPFIGNNWLPHFTICSINKKNLDDRLTKSFFKSQLLSKVEISKYSLWLIDNENHIKIKDYYL